MSQAKNKTAKTTVNNKPKAVSAPKPSVAKYEDVLTLPEAAAYLRLSETDVLRLVHEQGLPARQLATEWRFLRTAIQDWLRSGPSPRPDFWEASIGALQDDPQMEAIVHEAYRRRGHATAEGR